MLVNTFSLMVHEAEFKTKDKEEVIGRSLVLTQRIE